MIFAKYFYPRDFKNAIAKLESEKNLRYEPLKELNLSIAIYLTLTIILTSLLLVSDSVIVALAGMCLCALIFTYVIKIQLSYLYLYLFGSSTRVVVKKIKTRELRYITPNKDLICETVSSSEKVIAYDIAYTFIQNMNITVGDKINVIHISGQKRVSPDSNEFREKYCLRKSSVLPACAAQQ